MENVYISHTKVSRHPFSFSDFFHSLVWHVHSECCSLAALLIHHVRSLLMGFKFIICWLCDWCNRQSLPDWFVYLFFDWQSFRAPNWMIDILILQQPDCFSFSLSSFSSKFGFLFKHFHSACIAVSPHFPLSWCPRSPHGRPIWQTCVFKTNCEANQDKNTKLYQKRLTL